MIEEQNTGGATQATYVYGFYIDEPVTMDRGGQTYYYHQNALWSPHAITDSTGTPVERYAYDAYGAVTVTTGAGAPVAPNAWGTPHSAIGNPWLFTGRQFDEEAGLYQYRNRYYDAAKGRFLQRDLFDFDPVDNLYRYVEDKPTKYVDFTGLAPAAVCQNCNPCAPLYQIYDTLVKLKHGLDAISFVTTVGSIGTIAATPKAGLSKVVGNITFKTEAMTAANEHILRELASNLAQTGLTAALTSALGALVVDPDPEKACLALAICETARGNTHGGVVWHNAIGNETTKCIWKNGRMRYAEYGLRYTLPRWLGGWDWVEGWELDP